MSIKVSGDRILDHLEIFHHSQICALAIMAPEPPVHPKVEYVIFDMDGILILRYFGLSVLILPPRADD